MNENLGGSVKILWRGSPGFLKEFLKKEFGHLNDLLGGKKVVIFERSFFRIFYEIFVEIFDKYSWDGIR